MKAAWIAGTLAAVGMACEKHETPAGSSDTPVAKGSGDAAAILSSQTGLSMSYRGKPVEMVAAVAARTWSGKLRVLVSSVPITCTQSRKGSFPKGAIVFMAEIGQRLRPDGAIVPNVEDMSLTSPTGHWGTRQFMAGPVTIVAEGAEGKPTTVELTLKTGTLDVTGRIDAVTCAPQAEAIPPLPPTMPATIEIAKKKLPIRSARFWEHGGEVTLILTTGGESCDSPSFRRESELSVELTWSTPTDSTVDEVQIRGELIETALSKDFDKARLTLEPPQPKPGEIAIHGDLEVNGYPVKIDGKVNAVVCPG